MHRGDGLGRPPGLFPFGTFCPKVKARRVSVGPQKEGATRHDFWAICPEAAGFGRLLNKRFCVPFGAQK